jgi:hypothetical protein
VELVDGYSPGFAVEPLQVAGNRTRPPTPPGNIPTNNVLCREYFLIAFWGLLWYDRALRGGYFRLCHWRIER